MKANHNCYPEHIELIQVVYQVKDTIFWKQITTVLFKKNSAVKLFIKSKIQFFESKSQLRLHRAQTRYSCLSSQRYNFLKANHNCFAHLKNGRKLFIKSKIQFFESKSQHTAVRKFKWKCCLSSQRYNFLKANHNNCSPFHSSIVVVYQVKDTIFWKQITTDFWKKIFWSKLFIKSKIQFFESKSQPTLVLREFRISCLSSQRYNFLKANHNLPPQIVPPVRLFIKSKIQFFESKSQRILRILIDVAELFIKSKIQFFESYSQQVLNIN